MADGATFQTFPKLESLTDKFIYSDDVEAILQIALTTDKNIILFGAGGHAKSEMVETALIQFKPFVQTFGEGMTEERLFGGLEMKLFQEQGQIKYQTNNSFMAHEIVIFEEFFDAPTNVLLSVKDILTSKRFRNGSQTEQIKTKVVIALTNRTPEEVGEDLSSKALLERFPLKLEVKWKHYTALDFQKLFKKVLKTDSLDYLAEIFAEIHESNGFISPRTAIHAGEVALKCGISALKYIDGIDADVYKKLEKMKKQAEKEAREDEELKEFQNDVKALIANFEKASSALDYLNLKKRADSLLADLTELSVKDKNLQTLNQLIQSVNFIVKNSVEKSRQALRNR